MIIRESQLAKLSPNEEFLVESRRRERYFSATSRATVFLSHKHDDIVQLKQVANILQQLNGSVYVDWLDNTMPRITSGETAIKIKEKIKKYDKFILIATNGAIESKWCNWELGYGDAFKFDKKKIALFPIAKDDGTWKGNEYLQIYPTIQYYDGSQRYSNTNEIIPEGYYYRYKGNNGGFILMPLGDWLLNH